MKRKIEKVLIVVNLLKDDAQNLIEEITQYLESQKINVELFGFRKKPSTPSLEKVDFVFSLGGDGTVLFCSRLLESRGIPILAVNLGNFGFITDVAKSEWKSAFEKYRMGTLGLSRRIMLKVNVERRGERVASFRGLNDAVISANGISKIVRLQLKVNETSLGSFRADGVIVSTPTGSTAYSVAAGGPILNPEMEAFIINPICPFTLSNRPIVISGNEIILITLEQEQRTKIIISVDGQEVFPLEPGDRILVEKSHSKALLVKSDKRNYYEVLRSKLNWSGG